MKGYPYLKGKCQRCGRPTVRNDGEVIDTLITLEKYTSGYSLNEYLGEWCSEECFIKDMKKYFGGKDGKI